MYNLCIHAYPYGIAVELQYKCSILSVENPSRVSVELQQYCKSTAELFNGKIQWSSRLAVCFKYAN
jgi:hypothetical protein